MRALASVIWPMAGQIAGVLALAAPLPAHANGVAVGASAQVIAPAIISAARATELLLSPSPGVLTLSIPGAASNSDSGNRREISLIATGVSGDGGSFVFSASRDSAGQLDRLIAKLTESTQRVELNGNLSTGLSVNGYIDGKGFQMAVVSVVKNQDGSGYISAIIPFD